MFVSVSQYTLNKGSFESLLPFRFITPQKSLIELTSFEERTNSSAYLYLPLARKIIDSAYGSFGSFPILGFIETYSGEEVEKVLNENHIHYRLHKKSQGTQVFQVSLKSMYDLEVFFPIWAESGTDSLFNAVTNEEEALGLCLDDLSIRISEAAKSPTLCFSYDLQGLFILGSSAWEDLRLIKDLFIKEEIEILDEINIIL